MMLRYVLHALRTGVLLLLLLLLLLPLHDDWLDRVRRWLNVERWLQNVIGDCRRSKQ